MVLLKSMHVAQRDLSWPVNRLIKIYFFFNKMTEDGSQDP